MTMIEFNKIIVDTEKPIYVQSGYNRFGISIISEEEDCILLVITDDADNPMYMRNK